MFGKFGKAGLVVALMLGSALIFALNDKYWLLFPFLTISGIALPRLRFSGIELGCLVLIGVYFVRLAAKKGRAIQFDRDVVVPLFMLLWIFFVFLLNPVGMAMFGSETIGGRFYFQILIGFLAMLVLSTIRPTEQDAKLLFFTLLAAQLWCLLHGVIFPGTDPDALVFSGSTPERSQRYAFVICSVIYMLLFARYSLADILRSPFRIVLFAALALLTVYSGKRRAVGALVLIPVFRVLLTGRERLLTAAMTVVAAIFLMFAVVGDGVAYRLPSSARRALAVVVPRYQRTLDDGGLRDHFRKEMRRQARYVVASDPWFGRKGFAMNLSETSWMLFGGGLTGLYAGHAYAGNWHNAWYAYAADFGIPCLVLWSIFVIYMLVFIFRTARIIVPGSWLFVCCLFYMLRILVDLAFSYTTGQAATTSITMWTEYGMLLAVVRGIHEQRINLPA